MDVEPVDVAAKMPRDFVRATWRGTTSPHASGDIGVSFQLPDGSLVRLMLDAKSARSVSETLAADYWAASRRAASEGIG